MFQNFIADHINPVLTGRISEISAVSSTGNVVVLDDIFSGEFSHYFTNLNFSLAAHTCAFGFLLTPFSSNSRNCVLSYDFSVCVSGVGSAALLMPVLGYVDSSVPPTSFPFLSPAKALCCDVNYVTTESYYFSGSGKVVVSTVADDPALTRYFWLGFAGASSTGSTGVMHGGLSLRLHERDVQVFQPMK